MFDDSKRLDAPEGQMTQVGTGLADAKGDLGVPADKAHARLDQQMKFAMSLEGTVKELGT